MPSFLAAQCILTLPREWEIYATDIECIVWGTNVDSHNLDANKESVPRVYFAWASVVDNFLLHFFTLPQNQANRHDKFCNTTRDLFQIQHFFHPMTEVHQFEFVLS